MSATNYTTRRFPRTLAEAFSDERAHCIDVPTRLPHKLYRAAVALACVCAVVALAVKFTIGV